MKGGARVKREIEKVSFWFAKKERQGDQKDIYTMIRKKKISFARILNSVTKKV